MIQLGAKTCHPREMILDDIFFLRLDLLLHMTKDLIEGREFSALRRQIVTDNARHIQIESIELGRLDKVKDTDLSEMSGVFIDQYFFCCAKELAMLMEMVVKSDCFECHSLEALKDKFEAVRYIKNSACFSDLLLRYAN